ncbi:MAG: C-terminal binding protein [Candidatus Dormibacteraeota bacterium]|nr:C-terminal binding protein [Candidatus Dormibacteraeota bacterium]
MNAGAARVLITDQVFGGTSIERGVLDPLGIEVVEAPSADEATLVELAAGVTGMLVCYAAITDAVLEAAAPTCRVVSRYGIGYDNIPVATATRLGIVVTNVPDYCLDEVADHTMALLLAAARRIVQMDREVRAGAWKVPGTGIHRLAGRRLALIGVGRIGRRVAVRAQAFGLEVVAYDPFVGDWDVPGVTRVNSVEEAVAEADIISVHAPLTAENRHIIGHSTIARMRRAPIIVNTSRGGLVDLDALTAALDSGRISAAALDVTEIEPLPPDHRLRSHPLAIVTPHASFYSAEAQDELQLRAAEEVARAVRGEPPRSPVNPEVLEADRIR